MATTEEKASEKNKKEGTNLLGPPTFTELENGRFKCVETGHEVLDKDKESYSQSKRCRLGLINFALSKKKPPLNVFEQDPLSRSKLICKLTGDTVNKSEEHIWKHINGKRFFNKLEEKEAGKVTSNGSVEEQDEQKPQKASKPSMNGLKKEREKGKSKGKGKDKDKDKDKGKGKGNDKDKEVDEIISEVRNLSDENSDLEEDDFWMPPPGERWDFDDGEDRWGSGSESESESGQESDEVHGMDGTVEEGGKETEELSVSTKRMSIEIGPSSFASRKKKNKKDHTN